MDYHEARAKGGVGLIILGVTSADEWFTISINSSVIFMIMVGMPAPVLTLP